ncbi:hypothetical protein [Streptomyces viridochromogenes]|uniref:hypothetical protein n=1 Tax=Streptomyces viridochromogenes TaxID=1938 RepID=UPI00131A2BED|nr:hypothetical protein [Streptomyces viridochromogenes]
MPVNSQGASSRPALTTGKGIRQVSTLTTCPMTAEDRIGRGVTHSALLFKIHFPSFLLVGF